jgi:hypothetical protein
MLTAGLLHLLEVQHVEKLVGLTDLEGTGSGVSEDLVRVELNVRHAFQGLFLLDGVVLT